jgi:hypothetical protein
MSTQQMLFGTHPYSRNTAPKLKNLLSGGTTVAIPKREADFRTGKRLETALYTTPRNNN